MPAIIDIIMAAALLCVIWAVAALILITRKVTGKGEKINFFLFNLILLRNLSKYQDVTRSERGRTGGLYYHFVIPMWIAFAFVVVWALLSL
jgi:hypothetical protein